MSSMKQAKQVNPTTKIDSLKIRIALAAKNENLGLVECLTNQLKALLPKSK